jgi:hypothetical protein
MIANASVTSYQVAAAVTAMATEQKQSVSQSVTRFEHYSHVHIKCVVMVHKSSVLTLPTSMESG